jgi:hypothetical protein
MQNVPWERSSERLVLKQALGFDSNDYFRYRVIEKQKTVSHGHLHPYCSKFI